MGSAVLPIARARLGEEWGVSCQKEDRPYMAMEEGENGREEAVSLIGSRTGSVG